MAEESAAERTEEATQRKKQQAREKGNVPKSRDLSAAVVLFSAVLFLKYFGGWMFGNLADSVGRFLENAPVLAVPDGDSMIGYMFEWVYAYAIVMAPLLMILFVVAAVAGVSQFGLVFSSEALSLKLEKLNPVEGVKRMFNLRSFVTLIMSLGKVALVLIVAYFSFKSELFASKAMAALSSGQVTSHICQASIDMMLRLAAVLLILALADYWYQRFQWEKDLRMTKQEVKEEMRDTDGDPHVKSKRRQIQRQLAMQRMMSEVPEAEVVVRNPTHFAVALKYDAEKDPFPYVVAKGMDRVAMKIIKIAFEHNVPVKYSPELARELHKLELGDSIPNKLWKPVVEVLAWVYKGSKADKLREKLQAERRVTEVENA